MALGGLFLMIPRIVCPVCGTPQLSIPARSIREAKTPNHLMELLSKEGLLSKKLRWGACKKSGCKGQWWRPTATKGWINVQVPKDKARKTKEELKDVEQ